MRSTGSTSSAIMCGASRAWDSTWKFANSPRQDDHPGGDFRRSIGTFFATTAYSSNSTHTDYVAGFELLTAHHVRHIASPLLWRPASVATEHGKTPSKPCHYGLIRAK